MLVQQMGTEHTRKPVHARGSGRGTATRHRAFLAAAAVCLVLQAAGASAQLTAADRTCVDSMNKDGTKVAQAQGRENGDCVSDFGAGKLVGTAQACLTDDSVGKVDRRTDATEIHDASNCAAIPTFGYAGHAVVNSAARQGKLNLVGDLFGANLDTALVVCSTDNDACRCQAGVEKSVERLADSALRAFRTCAKRQLSAATSTGDIEKCLTDAATAGSIAAESGSGGRIDREAQSLDAVITALCDAPGVSAIAFPAACKGLVGDELQDCLVRAVRCRVCEAVVAMDRLSTNCDVMDDGQSNATCSAAQLGLSREAYGVWDRSGFHTVAEYPFTRGQELNLSWAAVNPARGQYDWTALDAQLQFADEQNESFTCKVSPIDGSAPNDSMPPWMFGPPTANGGGVESFTESGAGAAPYTYGYYLNPQYRVYFEEMVRAFAHHLRAEIPRSRQSRVVFVRVDTGATGDESPYENEDLVPPQYQITPDDWKAHRLWVFEVYRQAFQEGAGPAIPMLYQDVDVAAFPDEWSWVVANVRGGFGVKYGGECRGHHLTGSNEVPSAFKAFAVNPTGVQLFSRNEMDQTFSKPYFQLNVRLGMYWAAVEQLNAGLGIWDVTQSCLQDSVASDYTSTFEFFNQWAAELIPATAGGGFSILHEGLDSSDTVKFPVASYGNFPATKNSTQRYTAICNAYSAQGARMDDLAGATMGSVAQRGNSPGLTGYNDSGWKIVRGNYERFVRQIDPDTTSKGLWRVNGTLSASSHPYDRFARRSDHASAKDTMYFDIEDGLLPSAGQRVQLNVTYLDRGTGQFVLKYDASADAEKAAFTVTKTDSNTWRTHSIEVTDWVFGNHGSNGSDLQLVNLATDSNEPDTIFHGLELIKLADVRISIVGNGTVEGRNNASAYSAIPSSVMQGQRLELVATPAPGWIFAGWSGALTGSNPSAFLFPTRDTRLTATFLSQP